MRAEILSLVLLWGASSVVAATEDARLSAFLVSLPGGEGGIGFDDLVFAPRLGKVLVPGGRTGRLFLIDPKNRAVTSLTGFTPGKMYLGGHGKGTTSADEGGGFLFAIDRSAGTVNVLDPASGKILSSTLLGSGPDYVRYVGATREVWVTEPDDDRIEVFTFSTEGKPSLIHSAFIPVKGGPESLVIDNVRSRAYTHLWGGSSVAIDLKSRSAVATWPNGCDGSRGIALDEKRGFLFAGCSEGKAVVLDAAHGGKVLGTLEAGRGVDVIAYNPALSHLYLPGARSGTIAFIGISKEGKPFLLGTAGTADGSHCVASDDRAQVWVCDPSHGLLLLLRDPFPAEAQ
jgi:hypothetical protein